MKRIMLTVAYDGTNYNGWQFQPNGRTIEEELNRALSELFEEKIIVIGASRTDTGVHALSNIAVFDTEGYIPPHKVSYALNQRLPDEIRIKKSEEVPLDFHPRKVKTKKTYEYHIVSEEFPNPLKRLYAHYTYYQMDVDLMKQAAAYLEGEHDFKSFCSSGSTAKTTTRTIYHVDVTRNGSEIIIGIQGNGFLYNMVRIIAGTLMEIGRGIYPPQYMEEIIEGRDRSLAGPTAPARGLVLVDFEFLEEL